MYQRSLFLHERIDATEYQDSAQTPTIFQTFSQRKTLKPNNNNNTLKLDDKEEQGFYVSFIDYLSS